MKQYHLERKYALIETDTATGKQRVVGTGNQGKQFMTFFSLSNIENALTTLYIPRTDGTLFVIEGVQSFDDDYKNNALIHYVRHDNKLHYAYLFGENRVLELGRKKACFYIQDKRDKRFAFYIVDGELAHFRFISYFKLEDFKRDATFVFEIEPGKFRIFDVPYSRNTPLEKNENSFCAVTDSENDTVLFFRRNGGLYQKLAETKTLIQFDNAYLKQNKINGRYELYGFNDTEPFLLGSGKFFEEINGNIRLDGLLWRESSNDEWMLEYESEPYENFKKQVAV